VLGYREAEAASVILTWHTPRSSVYLYIVLIHLGPILAQIRLRNARIEETATHN
jgi:hypothetical protein